MDLVRASITRPVAVLVGVILVVFFGLVGLSQMPYQLTPSVVEPDITVETTWPGATPYEVEREIIEPQEEVLKGIPGLKEMEGEAYNSLGRVTLRFRIGTIVDQALLRVSNKLDEVRSYPETAEKPVIRATGASASPVVWMVIKTVEGNPRSVYTYRTFFEDEIRQYLERVEGVADLFIGGGTLDEMHVVLKTDKLAAYGLTVKDVISALSAANVNVSLGNLGVGRRDYRVRAVAQFQSPEEIARVVLKSTGQVRITLADVAAVSYGHEKISAATAQNGQECITCGIRPESGTNVLTLTDRIEDTVNWLNENKLRPNGIYLDWVYDQRPYIKGAIGLVQQNILIGGGLAVLVLLLFLGSIRSTLVVATSIPISAIGTFILMNALGRNLNVISLAGISFAVGMLVDNAIVVLENIDRHVHLGKSRLEAAYDGTREVWGAVLASTLTTVAVFLPVVFVQEEAGQLFKDIAIAVTGAVSLSFLVSVAVIPMFSRRLLARVKAGERSGWLRRLGGLPAAGIVRLVDMSLRHWLTRLLTILCLIGLAAVSVVLLFPKMEYLPEGNRNLIISILVPPPGLSYQERKDIGDYLYNSLKPYFKADKDGYPGIDSLFYIGTEWITLFGSSSIHEQRAGELIPLFMRTMNSIPGVFGISQQAGIFQTRLGRARTIDIDLSGPSLERLVALGGSMFGRINQELGRVQIRPIPSLELMYPEVRLIPIRDRIKAAGLNETDLGAALDVALDGRKVGEFKREGHKKIDLILKDQDKDVATPEELYRSLVVTPSGRSVPVFSLTSLERTSGINVIRHLERQRTITLQVTPSKDLPLEEAIEAIQNKVIGTMRSEGQLKGIEVRVSGAADKLSQTREVLQWNFLVAALITYLLMSALFGNFIYPLAIMFTVPLAAAGGFIGLKLVNVFIAVQALDILTMLGFVILIGVVVNNAILIVHQSLNNIRLHGMERRQAVVEAVRTRLRPIYMSAATSVLGMLPLVVAPGPGSELYRGLGSVVLGGIAVSTVFTVFMIPCLLMFFIRMEK